MSFARSHTLTSFDNVNAGFRSSGRLKTARSQERLIGGKKPIIATGSMYETLQPPLQVQQQPQQMQPQQSSTLPKTWLPPPVQLQPCQHHHAPIHLHQPISGEDLATQLPASQGTMRKALQPKIRHFRLSNQLKFTRICIFYK